ncbi:hypothetical protein HK105_204434 [Polyrhizophydium stewartii]|uniref:Uncharacterized protein n=1 Tax=Polyrhizophydium stewartii TaxID=2732419 RepID=A0ABR4N919_9FUNG
MVVIVNPDQPVSLDRVQQSVYTVLSLTGVASCLVAIPVMASSKWTVSPETLPFFLQFFALFAFASFSLCLALVSFISDRSVIASEPFTTGYIFTSQTATDATMLVNIYVSIDMFRAVILRRPAMSKSVSLMWTAVLGILAILIGVANVVGINVILDSGGVLLIPTPCIVPGIRSKLLDFMIFTAGPVLLCFALFVNILSSIFSKEAIRTVRRILANNNAPDANQCSTGSGFYDDMELSSIDEACSTTIPQDREAAFGAGQSLAADQLARPEPAATRSLDTRIYAQPASLRRSTAAFEDSRRDSHGHTLSHELSTPKATEINYKKYTRRISIRCVAVTFASVLCFSTNTAPLYYAIAKSPPGRTFNIVKSFLCLFSATVFPIIYMLLDQRFARAWRGIPTPEEHLRHQLSAKVMDIKANPRRGHEFSAESDPHLMDKGLDPVITRLRAHGGSFGSSTDSVGGGAGSSSARSSRVRFGSDALLHSYARASADVHPYPLSRDNLHPPLHLQLERSGESSTPRTSGSPTDSDFIRTPASPVHVHPSL